MKLDRIFIVVAMFVAVACVDAEQSNDIEPSTLDVEEATGCAAESEYVAISKQTLTLSLYDGNNALICRFPVAVGRHCGNKREVGDMKTPEGEFAIAEIAPAAEWLYDFDDGRGAVKGRYGNWFIRLDTTLCRGIGIHGAYDPKVVGTRATEGCIELRKSDLDSLRPMIREGMRVFIAAGDLDREADGYEAATTVTLEPSAPKPVEREVVAVNSADSGVEESVSSDGDLWHTVVDGDLVGRIAQHYGTTTAEIRRLNPDINIDRISIGQRIKISGTVECEAEASVPEMEVVVSDDNQEVWHTVVDGDLVGRIAQRYGTTTAKIVELNPDINVDRISIGQRIRVR